MNMIAGMGFAQMAWKLALHRTNLSLSYAINYEPMRMDKRCSGWTEGCEHCEYFNILDRAAYAFENRAKALSVIRKFAPNTGDCLRAAI